ncbi:hypothetical protein A6A19_04635 [Actinobacillus delphinicola]|uniref:L-cysteine desulfidase family protein n=1 Tax=Actinobacillus delphinicola TaxID=51161 RepID=UPI002442F2DD|nr:L-serine ammonia-lyase, iron-sulfur-dependent, subunit alpha [Actinobacillus delphinicola]MDG6897297.1 hypothetical protein [Actinobacillus delphinicola]
MNPNWAAYEGIIKLMVKPALGCTEPIAAAYAAATARKMLSNSPTEINVYVSDNLYKNAMGVFVPGTGKMGLAIAAGVGALGGNAEKGLEVLADIDEDTVQKAQTLIGNNKIHVMRKDIDDFIYCLIEMTDGKDHASVELKGGHTQIICKKLNNHIIFQQDKGKVSSTGSICTGIDISFKKLYDYATHANFEDIKFILDACKLNHALALEGLTKDYGLCIGKTIEQGIKSGVLSQDFANQIIMYTASASDARMGGATLPAMSNFGSGNQGITATIPVYLTAKHYDNSQEQLARALIISHLGAIYIKSFYPPLSAFCGNTVTGAATAAAMVYLANGSYEQSCFAAQNVLSDCAGMVCDGAKSTCAMKVKTATSAAINGFLMALQHKEAHNQGIVGDTLEQTIQNIGKLVTYGMAETDHTIIEIMSE